jgi:mono/diheme cytochrome c family protein
LAVLAIILWHFYNVHIKHWNWSMVRGTLTRHEMEEEHGDELEKIEAGHRKGETNPAIIRKRSMIYFPIAAVVTLATAGFLYWFLTFEESALTTVPPVAEIENVPAYDPLPATPTPIPEPTAVPTEGSAPEVNAGPLAWDTGIGDLFKSKCGACHGAAGGVDLTSFATAMKGGTNGVMIVPGDAANSELVKLQQGKHPAVFSADELNKVIEWINAGALEK